MIHHYNSKKAFTLAEVLITLGIIGVVAALTMPALVGNYQKKVVVERLKKVYTTMKQVEAMAIADQGDISGWVPNGPYNNWVPDVGTGFVKTYVLPYVDAVKVCEPNECEYKYLNSSGVTQDLSKFFGFYLKDGTLIRVSSYHGVGRSFWGDFIIDINGDARPNLLGRDVFMAQFDMTQGTRCGKESILCFFPSNGCGNVGKYGCYYKIFRDGWEIKDDYPW